MMKIIRPLFVLFLVGALLGCNSEENDAPVVNVESAALVGTWSIASITSEGETNSSFDGLSLKSTFTSSSKDEDAIYEFSENPNTVTTQGNYTVVLTTTILGQSQTVEQAVPFFEGSATWQLIDGHLLEFTGDLLTMDTSELDVLGNLDVRENSTKITVLTDTEMVIESILDAIASDTEQGIVIDSYVRSVTTMRKL